MCFKLLMTCLINWRATFMKPKSVAWVHGAFQTVSAATRSTTTMVVTMEKMAAAFKEEKSTDSTAGNGFQSSRKYRFPVDSLK